MLEAFFRLRWLAAKTFWGIVLAKAIAVVSLRLGKSQLNKRYNWLA
jgi:hypothetical protein